jgi:hypothetical protein
MFREALFLSFLLVCVLIAKLGADADPRFVARVIPIVPLILVPALGSSPRYAEKMVASVSARGYLSALTLLLLLGFALFFGGVISLQSAGLFGVPVLQFLIVLAAYHYFKRRLGRSPVEPNSIWSSEYDDAQGPDRLFYFVVVAGGATVAFVFFGLYVANFVT